MKVQVIALKPTYYPNIGHKSVGERFHVEEDDALAAFERERLVTRSGVVVEDEAPASAVNLETGSQEQLTAAWDLDMTPEQYMEQFPEGPHADLALRLLELSAETETPTGA